MSDAFELRGVMAEVNEQLLLNMIDAQTRMEAQNRALQEVRRHAEVDPLTQLPNRVLLLDRCARAIANAHRHHGRLAILFLDIDKFKEINDRRGHAAGDRALQSAARRLLATVRAVDTVSRFGGDEFVVLISEIAFVSDGALIAAKIIAALAAPDSEAPGLRASIGISVYPEDGLEPEALIKLADAAMYGVKESGGGSWSRWGNVAPDWSTRRGTASIPIAHAVHAPLPDRNTLPALRRLRDGSYTFELRAYGYEGSGSATKHGPLFAGGDGICRFWGSISESGGHASTILTVTIDDPHADHPLIEHAFRMQMAGALEGAGFSLLGTGPRGVIIEIACSGPLSDAAEWTGPGGQDESRRAVNVLARPRWKALANPDDRTGPALHDATSLGDDRGV